MPSYIWLRSLVHLSNAFDRANALFTRSGTRAFANVLLVVFLLAVLLVELRLRGVLPAGAHGWIPATHFAALKLVITLLLAYEVLSLVFTLPSSFARMVGKQFEVYALILIRKALATLKDMGEPLSWPDVSSQLGVMVAEATGALAVFAGLAWYYRLQQHQPITATRRAQRYFVREKKVVALGLLVGYAVLCGWELSQVWQGSFDNRIFIRFYTLLVFGDILLVLISLRYSDEFRIVFRNTAYVMAVVFIRLALTADQAQAANGWASAAVGVGAVLYAALVAASYNYFRRLAVPRSSSDPI